MPHISEISYSRAATIAAIRDYYSFLSKMYIPESYIIEPPETGWPCITSEPFQALGKTDEVIELLRYLPYLREPSDWGERAMIAPRCHPTDYTERYWAEELCAGRVDKVKIITEGGDAYQNTPPEVIGLCHGGGYSGYFLLDTRLGTIHWSNGPEIQTTWERILDKPEDYAPENERTWRNESPAWAIADFFNALKDQFLTLKFVPNGCYDMMDVYGVYAEDEEGALPLLQGIFRDQGWPDMEVYNKKDCLEKVKRGLKQNFPDLVYDSDDDE